MAYTYTNPRREADPYALPDCEIWRDRSAAVHCKCGYSGLVPASSVQAVSPKDFPCPDCASGCDARYARAPGGIASWWYAWLDGGLDCWSSDPVGPYPTKIEALAAAREDAGLCPHGCDDDEPCEPCDARS